MKTEKTSTEEKRCDDCGKTLAKANVTGKCAQHRVFEPRPHNQRPSLYRRWY